MGQGLGVAVETMGLISFQKAYRQIIPGNNGTIQGVTYPLMMAVINVAHGKVTVRTQDIQMQQFHSAVFIHTLYDMYLN